MSVTKQDLTWWFGIEIAVQECLAEQCGFSYDDTDDELKKQIIIALKSSSELVLKNIVLSDISFISHLTQITKLTIDTCQVTDITPLQKCTQLTNLTNLSLDNNSIDDISALAQMTNLTNLSLQDNSIDDISALAQMTNLTDLSFFNNNVTDISALAQLTDLRLDNNSIDDISALAQLTDFDLSSTRIADISALAQLMSKKYALRSIVYPYDNHYITTKPDSVYIVEYFDSKSEAEKELKSRLVNTYYKYKKTESFFGFDVFDGWASKKVLEKASRFYMKKTGKELAETNEVLELELSGNEIVELMILLGINEYDVIEIDADKTFYAIWINQQEKYFGQIYGQSVIPLDNDYLEFDGDDLLRRFVAVLEDCCPKGELSDLSDTPDALVSFIDKVDYLDCYGKSICIDLNHYSCGSYTNMEDLIQLNTLLKKPWFEIRTFTISELQQLNDEFKEKNKNLLLADELFCEAIGFSELAHNNIDQLYNNQLKAINCYQKGIDYAKQALLTSEEPYKVKRKICYVLYQLAKIADNSANIVLGKLDDYADKNDFYNKYLLVVMGHWQQVIDAYQQIMQIDDIEYSPNKLNIIITTYAEYNLFLLDRYLKDSEDFENKDACLEKVYLWLSELSDLLAISREKLASENSTDFLRQDDTLLVFENKFNLSIITVLLHILRNLALGAGTYADKISNTNPQKAGECYDIAKKGLYQTLLIEPTGGTALSILSMYIRHYKVDTQIFAEQLNKAKAKFEALVKEYPDFMGDMAYNRACIAGFESDVETAIYYLKISHKSGYSSMKESVENDSDFNLVSDMVEFQEFLKSIV